uniref:Uncharacterized protein n=1 Tax=Rhizophora mucronata TaxID=61149 RepID=A0A2P2N3F8_RHIMU
MNQELVSFTESFSLGWSFVSLSNLNEYNGRKIKIER